MHIDDTHPDRQHFLILLYGEDVTEKTVSADDDTGEIELESVKRVQEEVPVFGADGVLLGIRRNQPILHIAEEEKTRRIATVKHRVGKQHLRILDMRDYKFVPQQPRLRDYEDYDGDWCYVPMTGQEKEGPTDVVLEK